MFVWLFFSAVFKKKLLKYFDSTCQLVTAVLPSSLVWAAQRCWQALSAHTMNILLHNSQLKGPQTTKLSGITQEFATKAKQLTRFNNFFKYIYQFEGWRFLFFPFFKNVFLVVRWCHGIPVTFITPSPHARTMSPCLLLQNTVRWMVGNKPHLGRQRNIMVCMSLNVNNPPPTPQKNACNLVNAVICTEAALGARECSHFEKMSF